MNLRVSSIFVLDDYREAIKLRQLELKRTLGKSYNMAELAKAIRVQRPYLSRVFSKNADLSDDQLFLALDYLKFTSTESQYIEELHKLQRSGLSERRRQLLQKIEVMRKKSTRVDEQLQTKVEEQNESLQSSRADYFLDPMSQVVHMFLTIESFRKDYRKILTVLNLSEERWRQIVNQLILAKIVTVDQNELSLSEETMLLSKDSPLFQAYNHMAKNYGNFRLSQLPVDSKTSFNSFLSCSRGTAEKIKYLIVELIKQMEKEAREDKAPEEVYQFTLDFFPWN